MSTAEDREQGPDLSYALLFRLSVAGLNRHSRTRCPATTSSGVLVSPHPTAYATSQNSVSAQLDWRILAHWSTTIGRGRSS